MSQLPPGEHVHRKASAKALEGVDLGCVRRACGITQETVAAGLGVGRAAVAQYERRERRPPQSYCRVIAGLLRHLEVTW